MLYRVIVGRHPEEPLPEGNHESGDHVVRGYIGTIQNQIYTLVTG